MNNQLASLFLTASDFVEPLVRSFDSLESVEYLFFRYGWHVTLDDPAFAAIEQVVGIGAAAEQFEQVAGPLRQRLASDAQSSLSLDELAKLADAAATLFQTIARFNPSSLNGLPPPLDSSDSWESLGGQVFDGLLEEYLRIYHPNAYVVLLGCGCIHYDQVAAAGDHRVAYRRTSFDWNQLQATLQDPIAALKRAYHWADPSAPFDHARLLDVLGRVLSAARVSTDVLTPGVQLEPGLPADAAAEVRLDVAARRATLLEDIALGSTVTYEVGFDLLPAADGGQQTPTGLLLRPRLKGGTTGSIALADSVALKWNIAASAGDLLGVAFFPSKAALTGGSITLGTSVELRSTRSIPWYLIGNARTARVELHNPSLRLSLEGSVDSPELRVHLAAGDGPGQPGCLVVIPLDESDAFVQDATLQNAIQFSCSPEVFWSSKTGFAFNGRPDLSIDFPLSATIGPVSLRNARLRVADAPKTTSNPGFVLRVGLDIAASIGPVDIVIQDLGFAVQLTPYTRQEVVSRPPGTAGPVLGNLGLDLHFASPTGVGLSIDAQGVVSGGGFLFHDESQHLYAGAVQLTLEETLTLKAFGLISTQMPDGSHGYSLLVLITAEDFEPIPLGMGFNLEAIGGMIAVHRTFNEDAMRADLHNNTLAELLFPKDPVRDAPAIIGALATIFPARTGSYLLGLMARIGRDTPPILMDLAVIYEFGHRRRLILLGRVSSLMPSVDEDLIRLNMDALGVLDFDQRTVSIDAVLVDSRLAHRFVLSGAMALRAHVTTGPEAGFAMAVGGFNPHFAPPTGMPALDRIAIALSSGDNPRLTCEAYFANTSNTIQYGARAHLFAAAYGFSIEGDVGFDVLVHWIPFQFIADFHASVQLKHGSHNLFKVTVDGELDGPRPLHVSGKASFEILWCDLSVRFDKTLIEGDIPPLAAAVDVLAELTHALSDALAWSTQRAPDRQPGVALRSLPSDAGPVVDPLGSLLVKQQVVPLNSSRDIDLFGGAPVAGAKRFNIGVTLNGQAQSPNPVRDLFAPAQYFSMSDDEKLASPSFESMQAGVVFGTSAPIFDSAQIVALPLDFETFVVDSLAQPATDGQPYGLSDQRLLEQLRVAALAAAPVRSVGRARFRDVVTPPAATLTPPRWAIVSLSSESVVAPVNTETSTWSESRALLRDLNRSGVEWQLVPAAAVAG